MATKKTTTKPSLKDKIKSLSEIITAVSVIGAAMVGVITWCVTQINASTNEKLDKIAVKIDDLELNSTRTQLLSLIGDYPDNESEILKVADYYFNDLKGDWYMTDIFTKWGKERGIDISDILQSKK